MSDTNGTPLSPMGKVRYYTSNAARTLTGIGQATIVKYVPPDAELVSQRGDRIWAVWAETTLLAWAAEFRATYGESPQERMRSAPRAARNLRAQGGAA